MHGQQYIYIYINLNAVLKKYEATKCITVCDRNTKSAKTKNMLQCARILHNSKYVQSLPIKICTLTYTAIILLTFFPF